MKKLQRSLVIRRDGGHGFTVIEILVALAISLILLLGVIEIFLASQTSYALQTGMARLQENGRFALDTMARSLSMAGLDVAANKAINTAATLNNSDTIAIGTYNYPSDRFSVRYKADRDCLFNTTTAAGGIATDTYYVQNDPSTGIPNLYCNGSPLVEGVESMQVLYGQDVGSLASSPDGVADSYVNAANVTQWGDPETGGITTVRIALLVSTIDDAGIVDSATDSRTYQLLDAPPMGPFNDKLARRVFTRTIVMRNYGFTQ